MGCHVQTKCFSMHGLGVCWGFGALDIHFHPFRVFVCILHIMSLHACFQRQLEEMMHAVIICFIMKSMLSFILSDDNKDVSVVDLKAIHWRFRLLTSQRDECDSCLISSPKG